MNRLHDVMDLIGRACLAALFIWDGWIIIRNYEGTAGYMAQHGVPAMLLLPTLVMLLGAGALVLLGLWTRLAALALGLFCLATAFIFHGAAGDLNQQIQFWKDIGLAGGFFVLLANGARGLSVDALRRRGASL
jgi:putative oxidoreductase